MTEPSERDVSDHHDDPALITWNEAKATGARPWSDLFAPEHFNESAVRSTLAATGYPAERLHFTVGDVAQTVPREAPAGIALLRLDTDWYESTRHEMEHLYPRLAVGGVLIIDDYGHWDGARQAVDEYFERSADPPLLQRVDYTGRMAVKA
jgi:O-methyltransferase